MSDTTPNAAELAELRKQADEAEARGEHYTADLTRRYADEQEANQS